MPWVKLDDGFPDHRKIDALSDGAFRLHVAGLCHAAKHMTDGLIEKREVRRLIPTYKPSLLKELLRVPKHAESPCWYVVEDGYQIHGFTEFQKTRAWWIKKREDDARRLADWRAEQARLKGETT